MLRMPDPTDPYRGMSPVRALMADIDSARYTAEWNRAFFLNSAQPGGVIELDVNLSETEYQSFRMRWNEQHHGMSKAHRVALLEHGKWVDNAFSQRDMQFVELRTASRDSILEAFAFPKSELGITQDVNKANAETGAETFAKGLIVPRLERWKSALNNDFLPLFGPAGEGLEFDYDSPVPDNQYEDDQSMMTKVNAFVALLNAGVDPVVAGQITDLPIDETVTITPPAPSPVPVGDASGQAPTANSWVHLPSNEAYVRWQIESGQWTPEGRLPLPTAVHNAGDNPAAAVDLSPLARSHQRELDALLA